MKAYFVSFFGFIIAEDKNKEELISMLDHYNSDFKKLVTKVLMNCLENKKYRLVTSVSNQWEYQVSWRALRL